MSKTGAPLTKRPAWKALATHHARLRDVHLRRVELGKVLAQEIVPEVASADEPKLAHDSSTNTLIRRYRQRRAGGAGERS